jgi:hypothetical protein
MSITNSQISSHRFPYFDWNVDAIAIRLVGAKCVL